MRIKINVLIGFYIILNVHKGECLFVLKNHDLKSLLSKNCKEKILIDHLNPTEMCHEYFIYFNEKEKK